jgi:Ca-activated chloride channel family protein
MDIAFIPHLLTDLGAFLAAISFARPALLGLLLILPVLVLLDRFARWQRQRAISTLGQPAAIRALSTRGVNGPRWWSLAYPLAWAALVLALAGPRWGLSPDTGIAVGRDLVIVVDLSRSMQAEDMADRTARKRWEAARAGLRDLLDAISARGGHRVAVIVFAARPKLLCPLTTDYDHVRAIIEDLNGDYPPPECKPGPGEHSVSGTRIGAALVAAVEAHDPRFPGSQDILLISDGDDPVEDGEWMRGPDAAIQFSTDSIPIHVVGVGDPVEPSAIEVMEGPDRTIVLTRLDDTNLRSIARITHGEYLSAERSVPRLGDFYRAQIEPQRTRTVSDESLPQLRERYSWFLAAALGLFSFGWLRRN